MKWVEGKDAEFYDLEEHISNRITQKDQFDKEVADLKIENKRIKEEGDKYSIMYIKYLEQTKVL